ncbi:amidohydrolase family protein [Nakamurella sp. PAMC28650]|uniref:amidohydrolase family protein n=1 Tax=Nakamurella sp. PAMC28650 TaxID=2762325 RepID=UPI00164CE675|nr:amidohydrolase family protein [Nakamurella sp. PAMC28650]QNK79668.1 amidohydrolase family protein [Nakamurella sp. PAMC28650]
MARPQPLHITGRDAATGESVEYWTAGGVFVEGPMTGAVELTGWTLPGFVDAHCHIGYSEDGAVTLGEAEAQARTNLATGVLAIRDCGSPIDTRPLTDRDDLPILVRAGRHIAQPKRYIRGLGVDLADPADLPAEVAAQVAYGGGWVKLVGDWIDRGIGDLAPLWPDDLLVEAISVAHEAGCRVTAHVFGEDALPGLLAAGIDCIEHGTGLTAETIDEMVRRRVHLIPTMINIVNFPMFADAATRFPAYAKHMRDLHERSDATFAAAVEAGIAVHAGTDAGGYIEHGRIVDEIVAMGRLGLAPRRVLDATCHDARNWLGLGAQDQGDSADLVLYPADPAVDLEVLRHPTAVIRAGRIV